MKTRLLRPGTLSLLPVLPLILGCSDGITDSQSISPAEDPIPLIAAFSAEGVTESAVGSGHSARPDGSVTTFAFNALKKADGTVKGQAILQLRMNDTRWKVDIDCLAVIGNVAVLSGTTIQSTFPRWVGSGAWFIVADNGEGGKETPDRITGLYGTTPPEYLPDPGYCHEVIQDINGYLAPFGIQWTTVIRGNVQVKGGSLF